MFEVQDPSNIDGAAPNIPFLLILKFQTKGKRDLKVILAELERHSEDIKAMTEELREVVRWNLEISARQVSNVEPRTTTNHISPSEIEPNFAIPCTEFKPRYRSCGYDTSSYTC